jgi:hypothetical protein
MNKEVNRERKSKVVKLPLFWWIMGAVISTAILITIAVTYPLNFESSLVISSSNQQSNTSSSEDATSSISLIGIEVDVLPSRLTYNAVEVIETSGGMLRLVFSDYSVRYVSMNNSMIDATRLNTSTLGTSKVTLAYIFNGDTLFTSYNINIVAFVTKPISLSLDVTSADVLKDQLVNLKYIVEPSNANYSNVVWSSSNPLVATVDNNGLVTAKNIGEVVITATLDNNLTASARLNFKNPPAIDNNQGNLAPTQTDTEPPVITNLVLNFTVSTGTSGNVEVTFNSTEDGDYFFLFDNPNNLTDEEDIIESTSSLSGTGSLTQGQNSFQIPLTNVGSVNNLDFYLVATDESENQSNLVSAIIYVNQSLVTILNSTSYLLADGWLPINSITDLSKIRDGVVGTYTFAVGTSYATVVTNLDSATTKSRNYFLVNDIDFAGVNPWTPLANSSSAPFAGNFNGLNHSFTNFEASTTIFGHYNGGISNSWTFHNSERIINYTKTFENLIIKNPNIYNIASSSIVFIEASNARINNVSITSDQPSFIITTSSFSPLANYVVKSLITNYSNHISISTTSSSILISGVIGGGEWNTLINVYNYGNLTTLTENGENANASSGGFLRTSRFGLKIYNSSNSGSISFNQILGGFVGRVNDREGVEIRNSFNSGNVEKLTSSGNGFSSGGFIGRVADGGHIKISNSYNSGNISTNNSGHGSGAAGGFIGIYNITNSTAFEVDKDIIEVANSYNIGLSVSGPSVNFSSVIYNGGAAMGLISATTSPASDEKLNQVISNLDFKNFYYRTDNGTATNNRLVGSLRGISSTIGNIADVSDKNVGLSLTQLKSAASFDNFDFNETWSISESSATPFLTNLQSNYSTTKSFLIESINGDLLRKEFNYTINNSASHFIDSISKNDVTVNNLPLGFDYNVTYVEFNRITITLTGTAEDHEFEDSLSISVRVDKDKIGGSSVDLTSNLISVNFYTSLTDNLSNIIVSATNPSGLATSITVDQNNPKLIDVRLNIYNLNDYSILSSLTIAGDRLNSQTIFVNAIASSGPATTFSIISPLSSLRSGGVINIPLLVVEPLKESILYNLKITVNPATP